MKEEERKFLRALNLCYYFLKFRPRTKKEIVGYLHKKSERHKLTPEIIDKAVISLTDEGLINDNEFIDWFVKGRIKRKPKSKWVLKRELNQYGVEDELVEDYFFTKPLNEEKIALKALNQRWEHFKYLPKLKRFQKAFSFLQRRGFNFDTIKKTIQKLERVKTCI